MPTISVSLDLGNHFNSLVRKPERLMGDMVGEELNWKEKLLRLAFSFSVAYRRRFISRPPLAIYYLLNKSVIAH